jgi:hypothetical protein
MPACTSRSSSRCSMFDRASESVFFRFLIATHQPRAPTIAKPSTAKWGSVSEVTGCVATQLA